MKFTSSTRVIPEARSVPRHVAIIMDGNGRWANKRLLPRVAGHRKGVEAVRATVRASIELGVEYLTLFAFSSENWRRPADEVSILMELFARALDVEVAKLHSNGIRFRVVGDTSRFDRRIRELVADGEAAKIAVRNVRRDANEQLKKLAKDKQCSEDDERRAHDDLQKLTDRVVGEIDQLLQQKEADLLAI